MILKNCSNKERRTHFKIFLLIKLYIHHVIDGTKMVLILTLKSSSCQKKKTTKGPEEMTVVVNTLEPLSSCCVLVEVLEGVGCHGV